MSLAASNRNNHSNEFRIFHDVAKALTSSLDLDTVLKTIMEKMAAYFKPATWCLLMLDDASQELSYAVTVGRGCEWVNSLRMKTGETLARWVITRGQPLIVSDVLADTRVDAASAMGGSDFRGRSVICLPVRTSGKVLGLIELVDLELKHYRDRELMLLQTMADYAAIAIDNARAVRRIQELSITDDCTGLFNARHLFTVLGEELHRAQRFGGDFTLLFLDLDHFKAVNDEHGHLIGSRLLAEVGQCLRENLRMVDSAFRYGGDEFAIVLPQTHKQAALRAARRLRAVFRDRQWLAAEGLHLTVCASIGIATYPDDGDTAQDLVQRADEMMYKVKQGGRNNIAVVGFGLVGDSSGGVELAS